MHHCSARGIALTLALLLGAPAHAAALEADAPRGSPIAPVVSITLAQAAPGNSTPRGALPKLDAQLVLALRKSRGEPPFDKATALQPDIPVSEGDRVLVDIDATVSTELLNAITASGGRFAPSPDATHIVRVMLPLSSIEALASRGDVRFVSPAQLSRESRLLASPPPAPAAAGGKP